MINRKTYQGRQAPSSITRAVNVRSGINIYGEPKYRVVWAPHRLTPSGGVWLDWNPMLAQHERNEDFNKPLRRSLEVRQVRRYGPLEGWVLEKWVPPAYYGTPQQWYSPAAIGGTMLWIPWANKYFPSQGDFPFTGDFEYASYHFPTDNDLTESLVTTAIGRLEHYLEGLPQTPYGRLLRRVHIARMAEKAADDAFDRYAFDMMGDAQPAFNGAVFSGAGEKHESYQSQTAKRIGITSHVG